MTLETAGAVLGTALSVLVILGVIYKVVLLPNLREQFVRIEETHRQVTHEEGPNRDERSEPTLVDRVDEVASSIEEMRAELTARAERNRKLSTAAGVRADGAHKRLDTHTAWADEEVRRLWSAIGRGRHQREEDDE